MNPEETPGVQLFHRHPSGASATVFGHPVEKPETQIFSSVHELER
jgi:hypothetical protein